MGLLTRKFTVNPFNQSSWDHEVLHQEIEFLTTLSIHAPLHAEEMMHEMFHYRDELLTNPKTMLLSPSSLAILMGVKFPLWQQRCMNLVVSRQRVIFDEVKIEGHFKMDNPEMFELNRELDTNVAVPVPATINVPCITVDTLEACEASTFLFLTKQEWKDCLYHTAYSTQVVFAWELGKAIAAYYGLFQ